MVNGRVERCSILYNRVTGTTRDASDHAGGAGGIRMLNGTVRDCLIAGNDVEAQGTHRRCGGIWMSGGTVENCTVIHNRAVTDFGGIYRTDGTVKNTIVYHNQAIGASATVQNIAAHASITYSCAPELLIGAGNQSGDPGFVRAGSGAGQAADIGDAHLTFESMLVDAGTTTGSTLDLDGTPRPLDGIGDGTALYDIGCYELTMVGGDFRCGLRTHTPGGMAPLQAVFYAAVAGENTNVVSYVWNMGDGTPGYNGSEFQTVSHTYEDQGAYTVTLTVTNTDDEVATATRTDYVVVSGYTHVSPDGSHTPPFDTWAGAATNIQDAVNQAVIGTVVLVSNGVYSISAPILLDKHLTVQSVNGAAVTVVDGQYITRCFDIAHPAAVLDGFTVRNGFAVDGAGLYLTGGTAQNCIIRNNRDSGAGGGNGAGVWMSSGVLRNCVVAGNQIGSRTRGRGAGIYLVDGTVENCTVSRNLAGLSEGGIYKVGGTVVNTIIHDNLAPTAANINTTVGVTYSCAPELTSGTGNLTANPRLLDVGGGYGADHLGGYFRPGIASSCIDAGINLVTVTEDLDRSLRPVDGTGDTVARHDIGAYEIGLAANAGAFRCSFHTPTPAGEAPLNATFTAAVAGSNTTVVSYAWDFTDAGSDDLAGAEYQSASFNYTESGRWYNVKLTCENELGEIAVAIRTNYIQLASETVYVSKTGSRTPPYDTWETATRFIEDGILAVSSSGNGTVWVGPGTYALTAPIVLDKPAAVRGAQGASLTIVDGQGVTPCVRISHADGALHGLTIRNGYSASGVGAGAGVHMTGGLVQDCIVTNCENNWNQGGGIYMNGGRVLDSMIENNISYANVWGTADGAGIYMAGSALVSNSVVRGNQNDPSGVYDTGRGGGIVLSGANCVVVDCVVTGNVARSNFRPVGAGIYMANGLVDRCVVVGNRAWGTTRYGDSTHASGGAGLYMDGGTVRNSLFAGNQTDAQGDDNRRGGGVRMNGGRMENCTIVRNKNVNNIGGLFVGPAATVTNTIVYFNESSDGLNVNTESTIGYSCAPELTSGTGNRTDDPDFVNDGDGYGYTATLGNYEISSKSPLVNQGLQLPWMTADSVDLAGNPRILMGKPDMGAYELEPPKGTVIMIR